MQKPKKSVRQLDDRHLRLEYLGGRCAICRRSVKSVESRYQTSKGVFEFNHIDPKQKSPIHEKLIRRLTSPSQLDELDKCNLLCRICHGIWTNQRVTGWTKSTITLPDGRVVYKRLRNHGLIEVKKGKPCIYLFSDEPTNIETYLYGLGNSRRIYRLGFELEKDLSKLLMATRRRRILRIWDHEGLVFEAERQDDTRMQVKFLVRFSIIKFEGVPDDPKSPAVWLRNGKLVIEGQSVRKVGMIRFETEYAQLERALSAIATDGTS